MTVYEGRERFLVTGLLQSCSHGWLVDGSWERALTGWCAVDRIS